MSLLYWNKEQNTLQIKDEGKQQKNGFYIFFWINILNAIINVSRLFKEEFNFIHGIWIFLGVLTVVLLFDMRKRDFSDSIPIDSILRYEHKKNVFNDAGYIILRLSSGKKRIIQILSKKQLIEFETLFQELNIPKHDIKKEIIN